MAPGEIFYFSRDSASYFYSAPLFFSELLYINTPTQTLRSSFSIHLTVRLTHGPPWDLRDFSRFVEIKSSYFVIFQVVVMDIQRKKIVA